MPSGFPSRPRPRVSVSPAPMPVTVIPCDSTCSPAKLFVNHVFVSGIARHAPGKVSRLRQGRGSRGRLNRLGTPYGDVAFVELHIMCIALDPDGDLLAQVAAYYHDTAKNRPEAIAYLHRRGITNPKVVDDFRVGYCDRSLG